MGLETSGKENGCSCNKGVSEKIVGKLEEKTENKRLVKRSRTYLKFQNPSSLGQMPLS